MPRPTKSNFFTLYRKLVNKNVHALIGDFGVASVVFLTGNTNDASRLNEKVRELCEDDQLTLDNPDQAAPLATLFRFNGDPPFDASMPMLYASVFPDGVTGNLGITDPNAGLTNDQLLRLYKYLFRTQGDVRRLQDFHQRLSRNEQAGMLDDLKVIDPMIKAIHPQQWLSWRSIFIHRHTFAEISPFVPMSNLVGY